VLELPIIRRGEKIMDFNLHGFIILVLILFAAPKLNDFVKEKSDKRMTVEDFTIRMSRVYAWYFTFGVFIMAFVVIMTLIEYVDRAFWEYLWVFTLFLFALITAIRMQFWKLRVKEGVFNFRPVFRKSRKFTLDDISSLSYTKSTSQIDKNRYITLYSRGRLLIQESSSKIGFDTLLNYLK
jgi:hypothetical protein